MDYQHESDVDEIPDINLPVNIQPYMYEPIARCANDESLGSLDESSSGSSETESDDESEAEIIPSPSVWCSCNNCGPMPTLQESKCCQDTNIVDGKVESEGLQCITEHEGFRGNCLNIHVLEASFYQTKHEDGRRAEPIHETYRYLAYRRFSWWIYHILGHRNRRIHPACVVTAIRNRFPSEEYCGFKYPE